MAKYYHIKKTDIDYMIRQITAAQMKTGLFYNITVLPYRGNSYNPEIYCTMKIG